MGGVVKEEDKSKPRATKTDPDHIDSVRAQEDKRRMPIVEGIILKGEADASVKDAGLGPPTPVRGPGDGTFHPRQWLLLLCTHAHVTAAIWGEGTASHWCRRTHPLHERPLEAAE